MDCILVIGNGETVSQAISQLLGTTLHAKNSNVFLLPSANWIDSEVLASLRSNEHIQVLTYEQYKKALGYKPRHKELARFNTETPYDWLRTGCEHFSVFYSGQFDLFSARKDEVVLVDQIESLDLAVISCTGALFAFVRKQSVGIYINCDYQLVYDFKLSEDVKSVMFDPHDKYIAIITNNSIEIYDIFKGLLLYESKTKFKCDVIFTDDGIYIGDQFYKLDDSFDRIKSDLDKISLDANNLRVKLNIKTDLSGKRIAKFLFSKPQQLIYQENGSVFNKNQMNVSNVQFFYSKTRLYALLTKQLGNTTQYSIESYSGKNITANLLSCKPLTVAFSDSGFTILTNRHELQFYKREKYNYTLKKSILKKGGGIISMMDDVVCFYDVVSQNVEFYDSFVLRSVHSLASCTNLVWSQSGLYVAAFASDELVGSILQIFNLNGKLVFKKTFSRLTSFQWRTYAEPTKEELEILNGSCEYEESDSKEDEQTMDVALLVSQWKAYLQSKCETALL